VNTYVELPFNLDLALAGHPLQLKDYYDIASFVEIDKGLYKITYALDDEEYSATYTHFEVQDLLRLKIVKPHISVIYSDAAYLCESIYRRAFGPTPKLAYENWLGKSEEYALRWLHEKSKPELPTIIDDFFEEILAGIDMDQPDDVEILVMNPVESKGKVIVSENLTLCPSCNEKTLVKSGGCDTCTNCGYGHCGI